MLISYKWLQTYLPDLNQYSSEKIADALTSSLAEVEAVIPIREKLRDIVVGEILEVEKHPKSEKLNLCKVKIGPEKNLKIVCGAQNVKPGIKVAVCMPGGEVYDPSSKNGKSMAITEREVRGIISQGMICSAKELALSDEHEEIVVLENDLEEGINVADMLRDYVFEIENKSLTHRGDCFSHRGIAREIAAILNTEYAESAMDDNPLITNPEVDFKVEIKIDAEMCNRFCGIVIKDIVVQPSPLWIQARLSAVGIRPINNVVDVTNFVMLDKGQPLHAYDSDKLKGNKLVVRKAKDGEIAITLDDKKHVLNKDMVVIANDGTVEDIAGIMGGKNSEISDSTKTIFLEAANWNRFNIRRTSRELHIRTEASTRFEKGQDPNLALEGLKSAVQMLLDISESEIASDIVDIYPEPRVSKKINLDINLVQRFIGLDLNKQEILQILERLNIEIAEVEEEETDTNKVSEQQLDLVIPTYRMDLNIPQDLLEEIPRIYGYAKLKPTLPEKEISPITPNSVLVLSRVIKNDLTASGLDEVYTYSFVGEELYKKAQLNINDCLKVANPISPDLSYMRNTLLPSLLEKVSSNSKSFDSFGIFEIGRRIYKELDSEGIHKQPRSVSGIYFQKSSQNTFFEAKGYLENLAQTLKLNFKYKERSQKENTDKLYHPGRVADIFVEDTYIGKIGAIHPLVLKNFDIQGKASAFELNFETLLAKYTGTVVYKPNSAYPEVIRDLSFILPVNKTYQELLDTLAAVKISTLKNIQLLDVFETENMKEEKAITIKVTLQSDEKTLAEEDIKTAIDNITSSVQAKLKGKLRDK